jgi:hypothetical protein
MSLDAQGVEALQNSTPTDWSKFNGSIAPTDYQKGPWQGDDKLHVRFFKLARIDVLASQAANRPVFKDMDYVEVMIPGDKNNIVVEPVWQQYKDRFPQKWAQYLAGEEQTASGTPLKVAPFLTPALVEDLKFLKIVTIEQLASLPDTAMNFMGAQEYKQAAIRYLNVTSSNESLLAQIQALQAQVAALGATEPERQSPRPSNDPAKNQQQQPRRN